MTNLPSGVLPDEISSAPAPIPKLAGEFLELRSRALDTDRTVKLLEARRPEAEESDREARAKAIRAGETDPGSIAIDQLERQIETAGGEHKGLVDACQLARRDLLGELLGARGIKWAESLVAERDSFARKSSKALMAANEAVANIETTGGVIAWLEDVTTKEKLPPAWRPYSERVSIGPTGYKASELIDRLRAQILRDGDSGGERP